VKDGKLSIRKQIAWAKAYKRLNTLQGGQRIHTPRKKKEKKMKVRVEDEELLGENYASQKPPALFVDGYNVIGYIQRAERGEEAGFSSGELDMESLRDSLVGDLGVLQGATGWFIEVVFDAYKSSSGGSSPSVTDAALMAADGALVVSYTSQRETAVSFFHCVTFLCPCVVICGAFTESYMGTGCMHYSSDVHLSGRLLKISPCFFHLTGWLY
jgi:hypothetical protein